MDFGQIFSLLKFCFVRFHLGLIYWKTEHLINDMHRKVVFASVAQTLFRPAEKVLHKFRRPPNPIQKLLLEKLRVNKVN